MLDNASLNLTYEPLPEVEELSAPLGEDDRLRNGSIDALLRLRKRNRARNTLSCTSQRPSKVLKHGVGPSMCWVPGKKRDRAKN